MHINHMDFEIWLWNEFTWLSVGQKINFCLNVNLHQACDYKSFIAVHVALSPRRDMLALIMDSTSGDNQVNDPW